MKRKEEKLTEDTGMFSPFSIFMSRHLGWLRLFRSVSDKIQLYAKVVAVADISHAMSNPRYYKNAISPYIVFQELLKESFGRVDPAMVQTLINKVITFQNGTIVNMASRTQ